MITQKRFEEYDRENPEIYELFKSFAFEMIRAGREHYSARTVIHRIRWHTDLHARSDDGFKINNDYSPFYARKFEREFPQHAGFFAKRHSVADREATHV
jgi:hypothetical protein